MMWTRAGGCVSDAAAAGVLRKMHKAERSTYAWQRRSCPCTWPGSVRGGPWAGWREQRRGGASRRSLRPSACGRHWGRSRLPGQVSRARVAVAVVVVMVLVLGRGVGAVQRGHGMGTGMGTAVTGGLSRAGRQWQAAGAYAGRGNLQAMSVSARAAGTQQTARRAHLGGNEGRERALGDEAHLDGWGRVSINWPKLAGGGRGGAGGRRTCAGKTMGSRWRTWGRGAEVWW